MKLSIKDFFSVAKSAVDWEIWSHLLKKSLMENFISFTVMVGHKEEKQAKNQQNFPA